MTRRSLKDSPPAPGTARAGTALRLGLAALVLLALAAALLAGLTHHQLNDLRQDSERTRAQLMAESLSQRIAHALSIGIPMESLVGVDALFTQRLGAHADIHSIALLKDAGELLNRVDRDRNSQARPGTTADAPVMVGGVARGTVRLTLQERGAAAFARSAAALLIPTVLLLATLAYLAARFSQAQGPLLRNHAVRLATRAIAAGRYDRSMVLPHRRGFDLRVQQLGHAVRGVHETLVRVRRLIASLRQTEPQAHRRDYLDRLLADAEGPNRFAEHGLVQIRVGAAEAQTFWASVLLAMGATALPGLLLAQGAAAGDSAVHAAGAACAWLAAATLAGWVTQRRRWTALSVVFAAGAALGSVACGLAAGALLALDDHAVLHGTAAWCGLAAGAVVAACSAVERAARRQGHAHAMPRWPAAALGAWLSAAVWLGPALGAVALAALGAVYGALAVMLPVLCAGFLLLRWNGPRSPWRSRVRDLFPGPAASAPAFSAPARPGGAGLGVSLAAGLLAALGLAASTAPADQLDNTVLACALGLGLVAGVLAPARARRGRLSAPLLGAAAVLSTLSWVAPVGVTGAAVLLGAAALPTAYLLGCTLAAVQRIHPWPPALWLLGATVGAALAAAPLAVGWAPALTLLAAALALAGSVWRGRSRIRPHMPKGRDAA
ncbi:hypothetical protein [Paracidovorax sp. MALMAid1276]|uniref:hypothetical protein n=1 Tax=Paracidovorax sp. MALMAid1276 TaxID=3411631 RepID=UPI003B9B8972